MDDDGVAIELRLAPSTDRPALPVLRIEQDLAGLEMRGTSPGWLGLRAFDLQPGDHAVFVFATGRGFDAIPAGSACADTLLGLTPPHFVRALRRAGPQGRTVWNYVHVPPAAHGRSFLQAVNFTACTTSSVIAL